ncbi:hypothetical protein [Streptomyces sp. NPDC050704]|uniref:hypothetical protein n=1 Tax=Streptomyces sp. NPDC050704 TaxID=3157219 RepID=UPI003436B3DD
MLSFDKATVKYWFEVLEVGLENTPARKKWRELMSVITNFPGRGTLFEETYLEGKADGEAKGEAKAILRVLEKRGVPVPDEIRQRVSDCTDFDALGRWLDQAVTVSNAEDLFSEDPEDSEAPESGPAQA